MNPLNSPLEVGMRVLIILNEAFPISLDVGRLVFLDHGLLHTGDLNGPESIHPDLPGRPGEIAVKRNLIETGLQVMIRAGLAEIVIDPTGIQYKTTEEAEGFINVLDSDYVRELRERAAWLVTELAPLDDERLRREMKRTFDKWAMEFGESGWKIDEEVS